MPDTANPATPPLPQGAPTAERLAGVPTVAASATGNTNAAAARPSRSPFAGLPRWALALRRSVAILFGLAAVLFPVAALGSLVLLLAPYPAADGALAIVSAVRPAPTGERWTSPPP